MIGKMRRLSTQNWSIPKKSIKIVDTTMKDSNEIEERSVSVSQAIYDGDDVLKL